MARAIGATIVVAVGLCLAACSGASAPVRTVTVTVTAGAPAPSSAPAQTAAASITSACALLPEAEAEKVVGATLLVDRFLKHPFADVAGVGDEAHREDFAIYFRKGAMWAGISVVTLDDASRLPDLLGAAASAVVSRLP